MTTYIVDLARRVPGRNEPAVIETANGLSGNLKQVIEQAIDLLDRRGRSVGADSDRIRENGGPVIWISSS
jgi:hypothetical protein